jgi:hypothetical protein
METGSPTSAFSGYQRGSGAQQASERGRASAKSVNGGMRKGK